MVDCVIRNDYVNMLRFIHIILIPFAQAPEPWPGAPADELLERAHRSVAWTDLSVSAPLLCSASAQLCIQYSYTGIVE